MSEFEEVDCMHSIKNWNRLDGLERYSNHGCCTERVHFIWVLVCIHSKLVKNIYLAHYHFLSSFKSYTTEPKLSFKVLISTLVVIPIRSDYVLTPMGRHQPASSLHPCLRKSSHIHHPFCSQMHHPSLVQN